MRSPMLPYATCGLAADCLKRGDLMQKPLNAAGSMSALSATAPIPGLVIA
jgi:hypothetical protein